MSDSLILTTTWIPCRDSCSWWSPRATRAPSPRARPETSRASSSVACVCSWSRNVPRAKSALRSLPISDRRPAPCTNYHWTNIFSRYPALSNLRRRERGSHSRGRVHDPDANRAIRSSRDLSAILPGCSDNGHWSPRHPCRIDARRTVSEPTERYRAKRCNCLFLRALPRTDPRWLPARLVKVTVRSAKHLDA